MKQALKAVAVLANTDLKTASTLTRKHPLWDEEIHIEEELINLRESLETNAAAQESLQKYPQMRKDLVREQRVILRHCIGLVTRMVHHKKLPREYDERDVTYALTTLARLLVKEAQRVGKEIDAEILEILKPFLTVRQRLALGEWRAISPRIYLQLALRRLSTVWQFN